MSASGLVKSAKCRREVGERPTYGSPVIRELFEDVGSAPEAARSVPRRQGAVLQTCCLVGSSSRPNWGLASDDGPCISHACLNHEDMDSRSAAARLRNLEGLRRSASASTHGPLSLTNRMRRSPSPGSRSK